MKYAVRMTEEAERLLEETMGWYADRDHDVAVKWYHGFAEAIQSLAQNPQRHGLARENEEFPYNLYAMHYGSGKRMTHRAVFHIGEDFVEVLTIRHHAQQDLSPDDVRMSR